LCRSSILPMSLRAPYHVLAILLALSIGGCTNATVAEMPMRMAGKPADQSSRTRPKSYTELVRGFDRSLTRAEKNAFIIALQNDRERAQAARLR
jgi:hypothetical protein